jgi:glycolate dehydrogenase FAD-linked subunit
MRAELATLVGAEYVLDAPPDSPYNRDSARRRGLVGRADAVVVPGDAGEVTAIVRWCYAHDVPIVARGGGTGLLGGAVPVRGGVVVSLERLRRVRELEPALWRIYPEAGVSTHDVQRLARENGLFFAPDPGASEQSQIGGNVATNAGGPHALKYGVTGAWVTGLEVVLAPGELVHIGGWARKDVTGYDLKNLLIGSEGTLGVITAVQLRLRPAPEARIALVVSLPGAGGRGDGGVGSGDAVGTVEAGCAAMLDVMAAGIEPAALEFIDAATLEYVAAGYPGEIPDGVGFALLVELDGMRAEAERERDAVLELLSARATAIEQPEDEDALWRWRDGFNGVVTGVRGGKVSEDVSFPVERLAEGLDGFARIAARHGMRSCAWGHGGDGNVHATVLVDPSDEAELDRAEDVGAELFELVCELGGSIAAEHGVGLLKSGMLAPGWDPRAVELHEEIKRVFDPKGLFNPGKKLGR